MRLLKAIEMADRLCPNPYTQEEKIRWCEEVTAGIRRDVKKVYNTLTYHLSGEEKVELPDGLVFENVEAAYLDGEPLSKVDLRSFAAELCLPPGRHGALTLVVLDPPDPVRQITLQGEFDLSENFIKMADPPFLPGDTLQWVYLPSADAEPDWSASEECYVVDCVYDGIMLDQDTFTPQTGAPLALRRCIDDVTEIDEAPYDGMYVEYLLAKMALYQHDYTSYSAHMAQYNSLYDNLRREYRSRAPLNPLAGFRNYWQA
ncbi:MAG: hypothetical protein IJB80_00455 [Clostridia bacterium]|nr:hypothetical protein [Clostridia bacterium]